MDGVIQMDDINILNHGVKQMVILFKEYNNEELR